MRQRATALRKANNYEQALPLYRQMWADQQRRSEWDGWGYANCLRKLGRPREALEVCRQVHQAYPDFVPNRTEYGWCLYDLVLKRDEDAIASNPGEFFRAAEEILSLAGHDQFSPRAHDPQGD